MKSKVLVSSIVTIALCLSLIAGSTFALFTDQTKFGIEVASGDVEIYATASIAGVYSAKGADNDLPADEFLLDENGHGYYHEGPLANDTFTNGGNAVINGANLTINRITPGDRVDVTINVDNRSDVAMVYRYKIIAEDTNLAYGMVVSVGDNSADPTAAPALEAYEGLATWTSKWYPVIPAADGQPSAIPTYTFSVELPVYAGNEYQSEKNAQEDGRPAGEQSVNYTILVEAVQGNAVTDDESAVTLFQSTPIGGTAEAPAEGSDYVGNVIDHVNNVLAIQNAVLTNNAAVTLHKTYDTVVLENVVADVNGSLITATSDNTIILYHCDITLDEGEFLIDVIDGVTVGQVMINNVTVNGVLLETNADARAYFGGQVNFVEVYNGDY